MANKCINQILLTGERNDLIKLIQSEFLNYKKNKTYQFHENILMILFQTDWKPARKEIQKISEAFPLVKFELIYIEPLLKRAGIIWFEAGEIEKHIINFKASLMDLKNKLIPEVFDMIKALHLKNSVCLERI